MQLTVAGTRLQVPASQAPKQDLEMPPAPMMAASPPFELVRVGVGTSLHHLCDVMDTTVLPE
jgi:hypothetical protein